MPDPQPEPVTYVTEVSTPFAPVTELQRLHVRMKEPEPEPEAGA